MPRVWLSIGSNIEPEDNVRAVLKALRQLFGQLVVSPVYKSEAVGFSGAPFLNLIVGIDTELRPTELHLVAAELEQAQGRVRRQQGCSDRTLDVDILTFGDELIDEGGKPLPRDDIERYAFVLRPLADVAPSEVHPRLGMSYVELWESKPEWHDIEMEQVPCPDERLP